MSRRSIRNLQLCRLLCLAFLCALLTGPTGAGHAEGFSGSFASAVLMDAETGEILLESNSHRTHQPASIVKMMVALIVMEKIEEGRIHLEDEIKVSRKASQMGGSQVYLKEGEVFTLEQLMKAMMVHSGNDAAVSVAEHVAGSAEAFVDLMNMKARELGLAESVFRSVHGLPPGKGQEPDLTSAYDLARLARAAIRYPKLIEWCSIVTEPFRGGAFTLHNTNKLLTRYRGVDGIKTGYTKASGYSIAATATRDSSRMIAVVMGAPTDQARSVEVTRLLTIGFNMFKHVPLARAGQALTKKLPVRNGKKEEIDLRYSADLSVSVRAERVPEVVLVEELSAAVEAPVQEGKPVGKASAKLGDQVLLSVDIVTAETVERASLFERFFR
jgi:D-alanyl-D-alanine carboxypeptidase (penicillin-binding protein 5/6)